MKKLLSIFLATAMLISLIPAVFAADTETEAGIKVVYDFKNKFVVTNPPTPYSALIWESNDGFWQYADNSRGAEKMENSGGHLRADSGNVKVVAAKYDAEIESWYWIAFKISIPKTGDYGLSVTATPVSGGKKNHIDAFVFKVNSVESISEGFKDEKNKLSTNQFSDDTGEQTLVFKGGKIPLEADEYYFVFKPTSKATSGGNFKDNGYVFLNYLTLTEGDGSKSVPMISSLTVDGNKVTATAAKMSNNTDATDVTYSYAVAVDDAALAEVDANTGVVTGLADGTATIIATATKDGLSSSKSIEVEVTAPVTEPEVTPVYEEAFGEDTYEIEENVNVNPDVKVVAYANGEKLSQETTSATKTGDVYEVKTDATIGDYTFRYWARGLENAEKGNKRIVSLENNFTYSAEKGDANWLIAVYTKDGEDAETEYFNANGQLIPDATDATRPYMLGYGYATDWKDNGNGIKEAVYGNGVQSYNITVNGKSDLYKYGAKIVCPTVEVPENKYFWGWTKKVGNAAAELVSTETNYTFYAWEDCVVEPMFGDSELVRGDIIARKILISKLDIGNNESVIKAEFIGFGDAVERGITLGTKDYAMTRDDATQFAIINNVNATEISAYAILSDGTKYVYTYVAPTAE